MTIIKDNRWKQRFANYKRALSQKEIILNLGF